MFYIVKVGTITNAQRAKNALKYRGIKSNVIRLQNPKKGDGCGYAVQVYTDEIDRVVRIIENENIFVRGVDTP